MKSNEFVSTDYLLVENIQKLDDLGDYESKQIITFDYASHIFLNKQKILHLISDEFHSFEELHDLENNIYSLVKWYNVESIKDIIFDDDINLGELFFLEFRDELVSFLKKFIEISNLVKKNPNSHYYTSVNILELISTFTKNVTKINHQNKNLSIHDSIDVPFQFGSKHFTMKLSTKNASMIQNFLNKLNPILFLNKKINKNSPSILIVNFSTIKNEIFLLESKNFNLNIIKYDRTTPAIWNRNSFNIIKNSHCIIENESTLLNKICQEKINKNKQLFLSKLDLLFSSKNLENHFTLNQLYFCNAIKPLLTRLCEKRFIQAAKEIELAKKLFKKYSFSKILLFNETLMVEQIILKLSKKHKIPTFVLQHGMFYDSDQMISENFFQQTFPTKIDYYLSWGNLTKNFILKNKNNFKKIKIIGSIFFDKAFQNKVPSYSETNYILLVSDPLAFNRPIDLSVLQKELYKNTIKQICKIISKNSKKLIIKPHPQKNEYEDVVAKEIDPTIKIIHSGDIQPLIKSTDLVIATDTTTVILEAMILQKPVISIRMKDQYGLPEIFNYCEQINVDSLDSWIKSFYNDPELKNKLIAKGNEFLKLYFANQGTASKNLLKLIE